MAGPERNLRLYGWHQSVSGLLFWFPTWFLYLIERVGLATGSRLLAVYFLAVVVVEVPSGWMSDRFGRVLTLRLSAASWIGAFLFFVGAGFLTRSGIAVVTVLALAQVLLAVGYALRSGTDTSYHFDTLEAAGRSADFEERESRVSRNMFAATALAAIGGGLLGYIDLRLPFAASLVAATFQFGSALALAEPPTVAGHPSGSVGKDNQIRSCLRYLKNPGVAWVFVFMTVQQPLEGLAGDQMQPWLAALVGRPLSTSTLAALYSGLLMAVISIVGAVPVAVVPQLRALFGLRGALAVLAVVEAAIIVGMALVLSPLLLPLLLLRSTQAAAGPVLVAVEVAPSIARHHRAGLVLLLLGFFDTFTDQIRVAVVVAVVSVASLGLAALIFPVPRPRHRSGQRAN